MKILPDPTACPDKNGNGSIETIKDVDQNGKIDSYEVLPFGKDECVQFIVEPKADDSWIRGVAIDPGNHAWVAGWKSKALYRLHPDTGAVVATIQLGENPFGNVVDRQGIIWVSASIAQSLLRVDPKTKQVQKIPYPKGNPYGITVDAFGQIWLSSHDNFTSRYDPKSQKWSTTQHGYNSLGLTSSADGHVWVALGQTNRVAKVNAVTGVLVSHINLGGGRKPVAAAVDMDGYIWTINANKYSASKVDGKTAQVVGEYPTGKLPEGYSDFTGQLLARLVAFQGTWRIRLFASDAFNPFIQPKPKVVWKSLDLKVEAPNGSNVDMRVRAADSQAGLKAASWSMPLGPFPNKPLPAVISQVGAVLEVELRVKPGPGGIAPKVTQIEAKF